MLAAVLIGQGIDALRSPKPAADAARPALEGLQKLPEPVATRVPTDAETFAKANAAVQIGGGLLLATGKLPRFASAALAATVIPGNLGAHMFWSEVDPERKAQKRREFLADILRTHDRKITVDEIMKRVADFYNLRPADMLSPRRARQVARPRQIAMYFAKRLTTRSLPDIGRRFGGRDHTTVIHAVKRIEELRSTDSALDDELIRLQRMLEE